jgi:hypothetical protein
MDFGGRKRGIAKTILSLCKLRSGTVTLADASMSRWRGKFGTPICCQHRCGRALGETKAGRRINRRIQGWKAFALWLI